MNHNAVPGYYTWHNGQPKHWQKRKTNLANNDDSDDDHDDGIDRDKKPLSATMGRIPVVSLTAMSKEKFFLRLLLYHVPGATSFEDLRTVIEDGKDIVCSTYHEACIKRGLTENDAEAEEALSQAFNYTKSEKLLLPFYVNLVIHGMAAKPWELFKKFKKEFCSQEMHKAKLDEPTGRHS